MGGRRRGGLPGRAAGGSRRVSGGGGRAEGAVAGATGEGGWVRGDRGRLREVTAGLGGCPEALPG